MACARNCRICGVAEKKKTPWLTSGSTFAGAGRGGIGILQAEAQHFVHLFLLDGLGEIVLCAETHRLRNLASVAYAGEHDDFGRGAGFADALKGLKTVSAGHYHVEQNQVRTLALYFLNCFQAIRGGRHSV